MNRTEMKRCGRPYKTRQTAANSKTAGKPGAVVTECRCGFWHVRFPDRKRKPLKAVGKSRSSKPSVRSAGTGSSFWKRHGSGLKPFPRKVQALIDARDGWCQRCGWAGPLHRHHRRAKGMGGDTRPHSQCPCNAAELCCVDRETGEIGGCHRFVHTHPEQARAEGWIVPQEVDVPGRVSVMRGSEDGGGQAMWPTCDGQWVAESPWTEAAA